MISDIKEQWQQAVEEFGNDAYKRFLVSYADDDWQPATSNQQLILNVCDAKLKPLAELFKHDIDVYGDNAYLMWHKLVYAGDATNFYNLKSNNDIDFNNNKFRMHRKIHCFVKSKLGDEIDI